jgi:hypothetical protein
VVATATVGAIAATDLLGIRADAGTYRAALRATVAHLARGDVASAQNSLTDARREIASAMAHAQSPALALAAGVPVVGPDVRVAIAGVEAASDVTRAAELVVDYMSVPHDPLYEAGSVDPAVAADLAAMWAEAEGLLAGALTRMEETPEPRRADVAEAAAEVTLRARQGVAATRTLGEFASRMAEAATGGEPLRTLVVFANGAELRATGGVPVFLARFDLTDEIELSDLTPTPGAHPADAVEAPEQFLDLFGEFIPSRLWSNLTLSLDGPTIGEIGAEMYEAVAGVEPDLVVVIDLVTAGFVLDAFPGLRLEGEEFDPITLATEFLVDSYRLYPDGTEQNEYLLEVFREVFDQLTDLQPDGVKLLKAVQQAVQHGRIVAWSPDPDIRAGLEVAGLTKPLGEEPGRVEVAVQNFGANKLDLFTILDADLTTETVGCALRHRLEVEARDWTPQQIRPLLQYDAEENRWWANLYLPPQAQVQALYSNGEETTGGLGTWNGRPVASVFTESSFGGSATVGVEWLEPIPASGAVTVVLPATVNEHAKRLEFQVSQPEGCS